MKLGAGILFLCLDDKTALLLKRSKNVSEPGAWTLPGGNLESGENFSKGAKREATEELGVLPNKIIPISSLINKGDGWKYCVFVVNITKKEKDLWIPRIKLDKENDECRWFSIGSWPKNLHNAINIII